MARRVEVEANPTAIRAILERIQRPRAFLKQVGVLGESSMQRAFREQRLGEIRWKPRYPSQTEPVVNIAGLVADLESGGAVKQRRFEKRPAAIDTGGLRDSVAGRVGRNRVVWGSTKDYAATQNFGLVSTQKVSDATKKALAKFLLTSKGRRYQKKLSFLLMPGVRQLDTEVVERRFLGITPELEEDVVDLLESHVAGE